MHGKCPMICSFIGSWRHSYVTICLPLRFLPPGILLFIFLFSAVQRFSFLLNTLTNNRTSSFRLVVEAKTILTKLTVTNKGCDDNPSDICEQIREMVSKMQISFTQQLTTLSYCIVKLAQCYVLC